MNTLLYIISSMVEIFLYLLSFAILFRILLPLIGIEEGALHGFSVAITEPIVAPVRLLLNKSEFFQSAPMDFSYTFVIFFIIFINIFIPTASSFL